jgi:hypothetical protein
MVFGHPPFLSTKRSDGCAYWRAVSDRKWEMFWRAVEKKRVFGADFKQLFQQMIDPDIS